MLKALFVAAALTAAPMTALAQNAPTDAQIAHTAYIAGQIDIAAAEQAVRKSTNPLVVEFANQMAHDHAAVNEQALLLVQRLGVVPEDNSTSQGLSSAAAAKASELETLQGSAFDTAYFANEIAYHGAVNVALRDLLIPSAQNAELKALLETGLILFTEHQTHAEHVSGQVR